MSERTDSNWIQTYSGRMYWPTAPRPGDVEIEDIAHHLSQICRYTGATRRFYSVAQHCVIMSYIPWLPDSERLVALLHDAAEAYTGDFARPVKQISVNMRDLDVINSEAVGTALGLDLVKLSPIIKRADLVLLATERRDLMAASPRPWISTENVEPLPEPIRSWHPDYAKSQFLYRYYELTGNPLAETIAARCEDEEIPY